MEENQNNSFQPNGDYHSNAQQPDGDQQSREYQNDGRQQNSGQQNNYQQVSGYQSDGYQMNNMNQNHYYSDNGNGGYGNNNYGSNHYGNNNSAYQSRGNTYQPYNNVSGYDDSQLELEEPVKISEWVVSMLLMIVPCVNIIMVFVWAFGGSEKKSKSNFFKAYLIVMAVWFGLMFLVWIGIIIFALALS